MLPHGRSCSSELKLYYQYTGEKKSIVKCNSKHTTINSYFILTLLDLLLGFVPKSASVITLLLYISKEMTLCVFNCTHHMLFWVFFLLMQVKFIYGLVRPSHGRRKLLKRTKGPTEERNHTTKDKEEYWSF